MISCTRKIQFDAAHRHMDHECKCKKLHGHRYMIEATFTAKDGLDALGRVIDFQQVKHILGTWINEHWDHNTLLDKDDRELGNCISSFTGQEIYYLPFSPTAENMAIYLFNEICPALFKDSDVTCTRLRVHETPNCYAEIE